MDIKILKELEACPEAIEWCTERNITTLEEAWEKCERGDWMLWLYQKLYPENIRELTLAKGHCVNTVRHLMKDERSIKAVDAAIAFGEGKIGEEELRKAAAVAAAYVAAAAAAYTAAYTAADVAAYVVAADVAAYAVAAYVAADVAAYAAAAAARKENQKQTADICRKYLRIKEAL